MVVIASNGLSRGEPPAYRAVPYTNTRPVGVTTKQPEPFRVLAMATAFAGCARNCAGVPKPYTAPLRPSIQYPDRVAASVAESRDALVDDASAREPRAGA